jgi:hypothetical protein
MQGLATRPRRWALMVLALATLTVSLVACQASPGTNTPSSANGSGLQSSSSGGIEVSPTPTFPPFTIGAWPSDRSPAVNDTVTIYILCRVQDQSMKGPSTPPQQPLSVQVLVQDPINKSGQGTCGPPDGIAAVPITFNDPRPGYPVVVQVSTVWNGKTYTNETFFTPGATFKPTATPKHGGGPPTPTATTGP